MNDINMIAYNIGREREKERMLEHIEKIEMYCGDVDIYRGVRNILEECKKMRCKL